jgi:four helix bundle protein
MRDFRQLKVWEKSHAISLAIYAATQRFPKDELYGLTSQMRRAAVSISANIAEGCGKKGDAEFHRYLLIAMGSSSELEYLLMLARDLAYLDEDTHQSISQNLIIVRKMLNTFISRLK